ncbi:MAG: DUF494 family protein [Candidatus Malihini olakiniferum]
MYRKVKKCLLLWQVIFVYCVFLQKKRRNASATECCGLLLLLEQINILNVKTRELRIDCVITLDTLWRAVQSKRR